MTPMQEITITTNKKRLFQIHLVKLANADFECQLSALYLGDDVPVGSAFISFCRGRTADEAFRSLVQKFGKSLNNYDPEDSIASVDNPCNTELYDALLQREALGPTVSVTVNGRVVSRCSRI